MLIDTNADGIPDGCAKIQGNAGDTISLVQRSGVPGKLMSVTRVAGGATDPVINWNTFTIVPGHRYRALITLETAGLDAAYANRISTTGGPPSVTSSAFLGFDLRLTDSGGVDDATFAMKTWNRDVPLSTFGFDFTAPKGVSNTNTRWQLRLRGSASDLEYTVIIRTWLIDLTAAGAA